MPFQITYPGDLRSTLVTGNRVLMSTRPGARNGTLVVAFWFGDGIVDALGLKATDAGPPIIELAWGYGVDHGKVRFAKATNKLGFKGVMLHSGTCRIYARPPTDFRGRPIEKAELPTEVLNVARDKRVVAVSILPRQFFDASTVDVPMVTAL